MIKTTGRISVYTVTGGRWSLRGTTHNKVVDHGYDAFARAVAGDPDYVVNGMYAKFTNGTALEPTIPDDRTAADYLSLGTDEGFVRFKTLTSPEYSSSGSEYLGNVITFIGVAGDTAEATGEPLIDGTSKFIELALVAIPSFTDIAQDKLVSAGAVVDRLGVFAALPKIANSQCGFRWSLKFERT